LKLNFNQDGPAWKVMNQKNLKSRKLPSEGDLWKFLNRDHP